MVLLIFVCNQRKLIRYREMLVFSMVIKPLKMGGSEGSKSHNLNCTENAPNEGHFRIEASPLSVFDG